MLEEQEAKITRTNIVIDINEMKHANAEMTIRKC